MNNYFRCLVSKLFDVCPRSTVEEMEQQDEVQIAWGTGIAGHVAESGEPINIPDAYQVYIYMSHCVLHCLLYLYANKATFIKNKQTYFKKKKAFSNKAQPQLNKNIIYAILDK